MSRQQRFTFARLAWRGLIHHRRAHLAALLAVTTATAIITGAFVVGDNTKGGTTGILFSTALFGTPPSLIASNVLTANYSLSD